MSAPLRLSRELHDNFRQEVEATRRTLTALFERRGHVADLQIERNRPSDPQDFAFVGKTPEQKLQDNYYRCSFCQTNRKFGVGRIVISQGDRLLRLIGDECWQAYIDPDRFEAEAADYREYMNRVNFEKIRGPLRDEVYRTLGALVRTADQPDRLFDFISALPRMARSAGPDFLRLLRAAANREGALTVERLVTQETNFQEALRRDDGQPVVMREPRRQWTTVLVGRLHGVSALLEQRLPKADATSASNEIVKAKDLINKPDWDVLTDRQVSFRVRQVRKCLSSALASMGRYQTAFHDTAMFFSLTSLASLQAWSKDPDCDLGYEGRTEVRVMHLGFQVIYEGSSVVFEPPAKLGSGASLETERLANLVKLLEA